jgi:AraC-like DNA-binding protein
MSQFSNMQQQCERYREQIERLEHERDDSREYDGNDNSERQDCKYRSSSLDNDKKRGILVRIEQTMEKDKAFCDPNFSLSRLSEIVESNQTYVSQIINETYGKNFSDFLNDYRTREACERLLDTENYGNYTISGIAADVGYKAQSTFIRAFKKSTGLPPSVYQKMARQSKLE